MGVNSVQKNYMRPIIHDIHSKFAGTDVFIVGGGSSLKGFDFTLLNGKNVIAINSAYRYVVREDVVLFWGDAAFASHEAEILENHPSKYKITSRVMADYAIEHGKLGAAGSTILKKTGDYGYDPNVDNVKGNNSGTQALNFAINLHPSRIILLGFDMGYVGSKSHFHDLHPTPTAYSVYDDLFIPSMNKLAQESAYTKIDIINCSTVSRLKCFKKGNIEDYV